jgi:hypothetical protein
LWPNLKKLRADPGAGLLWVSQKVREAFETFLKLFETFLKQFETYRPACCGFLRKCAKPLKRF